MAQSSSDHESACNPPASALFDLSGRVATVTGGAGLLGSEFCKTLVHAGARVVIADRQFPAAKALADSLNGKPMGSGRGWHSGAALAVETDITRPDSVEAMVDAALQHFGRLDILVNSAALDPKFDRSSFGSSSLSDESASFRTPATAPTAFEDFPLEAWNQALNVNLTGAFLCCQAAVKPMLAQGAGVIINLSSIYGVAGPDQRLYQSSGRSHSPKQYKPVYYSVTKAGIIGLTKYLAAYYAGKNIRVNTLSPGGVYNHQDEAFIQAYSARAILGRMARKDEMNGAVLFLASDASAYMTGANLVVDGGWTTW